MGRSTYGIPERLGLDTARLSMTATWDALVDLARGESVDAVIIAGDLIDRENRRFEPIGPIERGLTTLARHEIPVYVVAGDDDVDTVRALAENDTSGALRLLGGDGSWQTATITGRDGQSITVAGWSATGRSVGSSPVNDLDGTDVDVVVLHGTPEGHSGGFAPIPHTRVANGSARLWIAGAPYMPSVEELDSTTLLVPGSTAALSPVDVGTRGAWLVNLDGSNLQLRQVPLAAIRFDHVDVDLTGIGDDTESDIIGALQAALDSAVATDAGTHLLAVCAHLTLYGRTAAYASLPGQLDEIQRTVDLQKQGVVLAITSVTNNTEPAIELDGLLERADPVGETARIISALDTRDVDAMPAPYQELLRRTATRLSAVHRSRVFATISSDPEPDLEAARGLLRREAWATLDALVRQRGIDQDGGQL
ncbi:MAG TPA: hypothetical protein VD789_00660 [Thermomicrobiales bacterium]|nr:hypothetical protein [Thermomicrobiales bacterium]